MNHLIVYKSDDECLQHHGILGMKWGIRRYQNPDGSLTEEGKKRYAQYDAAFKPGKDGKPSKAEKIFGKASNIVSDANNINRVVNSKDKQNLSNMSDTELRNAVNRLQMEQQYRNLKSSDVNRGRITASDILSVTGSVVGIAGSAAAIAASIYQIRKGN